MHGNVQLQMCNGIDESAIVVVFVTKRYLEKVGSGNPSDNCFKEFNYATRRKPGLIIAVPMEYSCLDPNAWTGMVGMNLGGDLYKAQFASDDPVEFEENCQKLFQEIERKCNELGFTAPPSRSGSATSSSAGGSESSSVCIVDCFFFWCLSPSTTCSWYTDLFFLHDCFVFVFFFCFPPLLLFSASSFFGVMVVVFLCLTFLPRWTKRRSWR